MPICPTIAFSACVLGLCGHGNSPVAWLVIYLQAISSGRCFRSATKVGLGTVFVRAEAAGATDPSTVAWLDALWNTALPERTRPWPDLGPGDLGSAVGLPWRLTLALYTLLCSKDSDSLEQVALHSDAIVPH